MKVNATARRILAIKRQRRDLVRLGYEEISCASGVGQLWELDRGGRIGWTLTDPIIGADGRSIYVKAVPPQS